MIWRYAEMVLSLSAATAFLESIERTAEAMEPITKAFKTNPKIRHAAVK